MTRSQIDEIKSLLKSTGTEKEPVHYVALFQPISNIFD